MPSEYTPYESDESESEGINISPLIDVIFILLLFFVVTSVFVEESAVVIKKPESTQAGPLDEDPLTILVTANQQVYIGELQTDLKSVGKLLGPIHGKQVVIRADGAVRTDFLLKVMDEAKAAGAGDIALAADELTE
jgi:biopolymer transport protein ExbD